MQTEVHALHDYLHEITNRTSLNLPMSDAEFDALDIQRCRDDGVKERRARYG